MGVFKELGEKGHFADVTLVSDDQIQTKAHKVVLSACSPVLKTLLVNNPHSHPLLYLRGIKQTELQAILKFMYFGETQIFEHRINRFVSAAKDLEVKDISTKREENNVEDKVCTINSDQDFLLDFPMDIPDPEERDIKIHKVNQDRAIARPKNFKCDDCEAVFGYRHHLSRHRQSKHEGEVILT